MEIVQKKGTSCTDGCYKALQSASKTHSEMFRFYVRPTIPNVRLGLLNWMALLSAHVERYFPNARDDHEIYAPQTKILECRTKDKIRIFD